MVVGREWGVMYKKAKGWTIMLQPYPGAHRPAKTDNDIQGPAFPLLRHNVPPQRPLHSIFELVIGGFAALAHPSLHLLPRVAKPPLLQNLQGSWAALPPLPPPSPHPPPRSKNPQSCITIQNIEPICGVAVFLFVVFEAQMVRGTCKSLGGTFFLHGLVYQQGLARAIKTRIASMHSPLPLS